MLTLGLWQISVIATMAVIAVLVGTLVVYARALADKVGKVYGALRRIEEGLISASAPGGYASGLGTSMEAVGLGHALGSDLRMPESRIREMPARDMAHREVTRREAARGQMARGEVAVPEMLLAEGAGHELSAAAMSATSTMIPERDHRVSYLTVRDLKVMARSGRRRSDAEVSQEAAAQLSARLFSAVQSDAVSTDAAPADAGPEPDGLSSSSTVLQELATATSEVRALLNESGEPTGVPSAAVVFPDGGVAEAHEEMYAYPELSIAPVHRAASEVELRATLEWVPDPPSIDAAHDPAPTPVAAFSNPTESVEDQPAAPISSNTDAELAEKRRKRTAELILAAHHRRRRARGH